MNNDDHLTSETTFQENGFHIMLDETSPYIAGWFAVTVLTLMLLKYVYLGQGLDEQGEAEVRLIKNTLCLHFQIQSSSLWTPPSVSSLISC